MIDVIIIVALLIALVNSNSIMAKKFSLPYKYELHLHYLLFYHLFFSLFFTWYILNFGGDSKGYWGMVMEQVLIKGEITWFSYFGTSTTFILWLCYMPSKILGLSYLTGNILFGFLGFIGIRYLFVLVATKFPVNHYVLNLPLFPLIFYIPNLHFWSSGVGKDSISFWAIAWFLFAIQEYKSRWWQAGIALFFAYYTRPHIGQALIGAIAIALVLGSEIKISYKIFLGALALIGTSYLSSTTLDFLEISDFSLDEMTGKAEKTAFLLKSGNVKSGVDISSYPWPLRIFTYMFRPLFLDAHNVMALLSSFENALYLYLSFFIYRNWTPEALRDMPVFLKTGIIMFIPITLAFANSLGNLGVIMRMKNMTMIYFLLFCFFLIAYNKKLRYQKLQEKLKYYKQREEVISKKREMELKKG